MQPEDNKPPHEPLPWFLDLVLAFVFLGMAAAFAIIGYGIFKHIVDGN